MSSYARVNVRITNEKNKRKIPMRASRGLKWENKTYKLKRSIAINQNNKVCYYITIHEVQTLLAVSNNAFGFVSLLDSISDCLSMQAIANILNSE